MNEKLIIAIIAQPSRKVPPFYGYGGAQRGFYDLIDELKSLGHEVILFAPGNSETSADRLVSTIDRGVNDPAPITDKRKRREMIDKHRNKIIEVLSEEPDIDIINLRWDDLEILDFVKDPDIPVLYSLHNSASKIKPEIMRMCRGFRIPMNALCESHKKQYARYGINNLIEVVYYGMDVAAYPFSEKPLAESKEEPKLELLRKLKDEGSDYLLSLGRIGPHKGQFTAIKVAKESGNKLIIAGEPYFGSTEQIAYFEEKIKPYVDGREVFYFGNATEEEKKELMRFAKAFLFPSGMETAWEEPFGRTLMESLSCGTPPIAYNKASAPEIIAPAKGYLVDDFDSMVEAVSKIDGIDRRSCRKYAEKKFDRTRVAEDYVKLYRRVIGFYNRSRFPRSERSQRPRWR